MISPVRSRVIWETSVLEKFRRRVAALEIVQKMWDPFCLGLTHSPHSQGVVRKLQLKLLRVDVQIRGGEKSVCCQYGVVYSVGCCCGLFKPLDTADQLCSIMTLINRNAAEETAVSFRFILTFRKIAFRSFFLFICAHAIATGLCWKTTPQLQLPFSPLPSASFYFISVAANCVCPVINYQLYLFL